MDEGCAGAAWVWPCWHYAAVRRGWPAWPYHRRAICSILPNIFRRRRLSRFPVNWRRRKRRPQLPRPARPQLHRCRLLCRKERRRRPYR